MVKQRKNNTKKKHNGKGLKQKVRKGIIAFDKNKKILSIADLDNNNFDVSEIPIRRSQAGEPNCNSISPSVEPTCIAPKFGSSIPLNRQNFDKNNFAGLLIFCV
jgi:hypothetical protein